MLVKITAYRTLTWCFEVEATTLAEVKQEAVNRIAATPSAEFDVIDQEEFFIEADKVQGIEQKKVII